MRYDVNSFQGLIRTLQEFWGEQDCLILPGLDIEVGAGTFHPASFLRAIGPEPWRSVFVQPSRRPADGRYGENPNRLQQHHQFQVILKPSPLNIQDLYLESLDKLGVNTLIDDVRFVEDNWESPTLGAWGLGWEVWLNGMEVTQFTYFQQVGGLACQPITGEITYGLERLAMALQGIDNVYDLIWQQPQRSDDETPIIYGDIYHQAEIEISRYNFEAASVGDLLQEFIYFEREANRILALELPLAAYELVLKASHTFNLLDARAAISVTERQNYILRIRRLAKAIAENYYALRKNLGFPLLKASEIRT